MVKYELSKAFILYIEALVLAIGTIQLVFYVSKITKIMFHCQDYDILTVIDLKFPRKPIQR